MFPFDVLESMFIDPLSTLRILVPFYLCNFPLTYTVNACALKFLCTVCLCDLVPL